MIVIVIDRYIKVLLLAVLVALVITKDQKQAEGVVEGGRRRLAEGCVVGMRVLQAAILCI